jgi:hypothetical protein
MGRNGGYVWVKKHGLANRTQDVWVECDVEFRPIRTAEEVAVEAMQESWFEAVSSYPTLPLNAERVIYAAIRDGKIPGVKLEEEK